MLDTVRERLSFVMQLCMACLIGALLALNLLQVTTRYFIKYTLVWLNDLNIFFLLWLTCIALPWLWLNRKHLAMDYADKLIPKPVMRVLQHIIAFAAMIVSVGFFFSARSAAASNTGLVATSLGWDESMRYVPFMVCAVLWFICSALDEVRRIRDEKAERREEGR